MPWRDENELKQDNQSYEDRYKEVEGDILCKIKKHGPYLDIDHEELQYFNFVQSGKEEDDAEFSMINSNMLDLDLEDSDNVSNAPVVSTIIDNFSLPNEQFYKICSRLNEGQQHLFNFIMQYALHCKLSEKNDELSPKPFQIFLSRGSDFGKSFLIKAITEYLKRVLRSRIQPDPNQNLDQPSVVVTASTGKATTDINGITLHSAFHLLVKSGLKSHEYKKPSDETLHMLRNKYQYLKVLIIDEISIIGRETFGHLHLASKAVMQNSSKFGGRSLLFVGDILQLPPVNQKVVFMKPSNRLYSSLNGWM